MTGGWDNTRQPGASQIIEVAQTWNNEIMPHCIVGMNPLLMSAASGCLDTAE